MSGDVKTLRTGETIQGEVRAGNLGAGDLVFVGGMLFRIDFVSLDMRNKLDVQISQVIRDNEGSRDMIPVNFKTSRAESAYASIALGKMALEDD